MDEIRTSPVPVKADPPVMYLFIDAFKEMINGRKIRRLEWQGDDANDYCFMGSDGYVSIFRAGENKLSWWAINDADIKADDWVLLPQSL